MKIENEKLLKQYRQPGRCENCTRWFAALDAHHYWIPRRMGGGSRLDHPWNLTSLCRRCHDEIPHKESLLAFVAAREGVQQHEIKRELNRLHRLDKDADPFRDLGDSPFLEPQREALHRALAGARSRGAGGVAAHSGRGRVRRLRG